MRGEHYRCTQDRGKLDGAQTRDRSSDASTVASLSDMYHGQEPSKALLPHIRSECLIDLPRFPAHSSRFALPDSCCTDQHLYNCCAPLPRACGLCISNDLSFSSGPPGSSYYRRSLLCSCTKQETLTTFPQSTAIIFHLYKSYDLIGI